ncbi:unnamed protein product [Closterium sp. NIES-54]
MVHQVLQRFGFQFSSPQPTPLSISHSLSAPPSDESVEPSGPYPELVGCLIGGGSGGGGSGGSDGGSGGSCGSGGGSGGSGGSGGGGGGGSQGGALQRGGASESALPGTSPAEALHTFTLDSGASCHFFCDNTTLTPLPAPIPVRLADPSEGLGSCPFHHCSPVSGVRLKLRERFGTDLPVLRLHSDRGGEFSSDLLRDFCHGEGILQSFTLPASP